MHKRTLAVLFLLSLAPALFAAEPVLESPPVPVLPEVLAQGGSFIANAQGYGALFYNPAGFASARGSLTLLSATGWVYARPVRLLEAVSDRGRPTALTSLFEEEVTSGGFGAGASVGIGYVGRGLGLGAVLDLDSYLWGPSALGAQGTLDASLSFVAGLAIPLHLFGLKLTLGADLRPLIRIQVPVDYTATFGILDALQSGGDPLSALRASPTRFGYGFGIDLGAILDLGNLKFGLVVRDFLNTRVSYTVSTFGEVLDSLRDTGGFPAGGASLPTEYLIPMDLGVGLAYRFDLGAKSRIIDPVVHAALSDLIGVIREGRSAWTALHLGAEVRLLRFLALRAGLNQGYFSFGGGLRLLALDLNAAVFTREMGRSFGDRSSSGVTVEAALRL
jgi:hypothetical protein